MGGIIIILLVPGALMREQGFAVLCNVRMHDTKMSIPEELTN